jgi:hypothetical protein
MRIERIFGHSLLWSGFLAGAFVSVRGVEVQDAPWSSISWPAYGCAMLVAVIGVVILRVTKQPLTSGTAGEGGAVDELVEILKRLHTTLNQWSQTSEKLDVYDVHGMIDRELVDDLGRFAELRESIIPEFGLDHYAQVMTEFALAERTVNRAWSASADGYVDEVQACLERATQHLAAAREKLDDARRSGQKP